MCIFKKNGCKSSANSYLNSFFHSPKGKRP